STFTRNKTLGSKLNIGNYNIQENNKNETSRFLSREVSLMYHGSLIDFFTLFLLYNDGKLGKSADSGAKSA
ncbi:hypothetical protein KSW92_17715, partial [Prevotella copri]|uniref:hypothetical protein n=1 Tax=Segatella copri TaxID=165179 RepID=UPI001C3883C6